MTTTAKKLINLAAKEDIASEIPEIVKGVEEARRVYNSLEDYPLWLRSIGVGYSNASRGLRIFRKIDRISDELSNTPSKFKQYIGNLTQGALGFVSSVWNNLNDQGRDIVGSETRRMVMESLASANRNATIRRQEQFRHKTSVSDIRKISDPTVKIERASLTSNLQTAFDRHNELTEEQLLEAALVFTQEQL